MSDRPVRAIILAGGKGRRMGGEIPKQYQTLAGRPLISRTLGIFQSHPKIDSIALVVNSESLEFCHSKILGEKEFTKVDKVVIGGRERSDSVRNGLFETSDETDGIVLVHDAVRPFVSARLIDRIITALDENEAVVPCLPILDSVKKVKDGRIQGSLDRNEIYRTQTPQGFLRSILEAAYRGSENSTDDASLVERIGVEIISVEGEEQNIKMTKPEDWHRAEFLLYGDS